jgi:hypothetical protein
MIPLPESEDKRKTRSFPTVPYSMPFPPSLALLTTHLGLSHPRGAENLARKEGFWQASGPALRRLFSRIMPVFASCQAFSHHARRFRIMPAVETAF